MQEMWEIHNQPQSNQSYNANQSYMNSRRYTLPQQMHSPSMASNNHHQLNSNNSEDLHAWSIYRQNLNSDFTDSALGSDERSPLPYGDFQLKEQTVQSILRDPRLKPRSELGANMIAYLKFGLPRVFPPGSNSLSGGGGLGNGHHDRDRDGRSVVSGHHSHVGHSHAGHGHMRPTRSETDLRGVENPSISGLVANRFNQRGGKRFKTNSESNLLRGNMDNILSKSGSQASLVSRNSRSVHQHKIPSNSFNDHSNDGFIQDETDDTAFEAVFQFPHLQVRGLTVTTTSLKRSSQARKLNLKKPSNILLEGITFDLRGGETMALICSTEKEGAILLETLAGKRSSTNRVASGELFLNGNQISASRLGARVAYARNDYRLWGDMTVVQTIKFHSLLKKKAVRSSTMGSQSALLENLLVDMGLAGIRDNLVESLTSSEKQRLSVACQLMLNTEIILLNNPTDGMDIFDTFFLVDYLRTLARTRGLIIILTIHPPTFEIFGMFNKVALTSLGRMMFYGHRREMLPYYAYIEYPCPAFKNPSDYYLDLVTLDDLSSEALIESNQRIENLADSYRRKMEPLEDVGAAPANLPPRIKNSSCFGQFYAIWMYTLVYTFPWNIVHWILYMIFTACLGIAIGAIYWNVRLDEVQDQKSAADRVGLYWTLMALTPWPILLVLLSRDLKQVKYVTRDNEEGLYSKTVFIIAKKIIELPFTTSIFLAYIIPSYFMAGISNEQREMTSFYIFIGYMLLYLHSLRNLSLVLIYTTSLVTALTVSGCISLLLSLSAGYLIHENDLGEWCHWVKYISPLAWLFQPIIKMEFKGTRFECPDNPISKNNNIVVRLDCGISKGEELLDFFRFSNSWPVWVPILTTIGCIFILETISVTSFILRRQAPENSRNSREKP